MSLHSSASPLRLRRAVPGAARGSSINPKLLTAVALLIAVLIGDALLILAAAPSLADLASLYVATT